MAKGELNHRSFHLAYLVLASGYIDATTLYSYKSSHIDLVQCEKILCHPQAISWRRKIMTLLNFCSKKNLLHLFE
jgi:hypothetical protein